MARKTGGFGHYSSGFLIQTRDCGETDNLFAWVIDVRRSAEFVQGELSRLSELWKGAYLLRCDVQRRTLLSWGVSPVDDSIADVPARATSWTDRDRVSTAYPLQDGRTIIVVRTFDPHRNARFEGKRVQVFLGPAFGDLLLLDSDCPDAGGFAAQDGLVAFHCVREKAGRLHHAIEIFDRHGLQVAEFERCRDPAWSGDRVLSCQEEALGAGGELSLRTKRIALSPGILAATKTIRLWFPIGASGSSAAEIAKTAKAFSQDFPGGLVVQMSDCGGPEDRLTWVAEASFSEDLAKATLARLRTTAPDAYLESCDARAGTLLSFRMTAVDPSIADIPEGDQEYWNDADRVSSARPLPDGRTIILVRAYDAADGSELLGRSERVLLGMPDGSRSVLVNSCNEAGGFVTRKGLVALHCVKEAIAHLPFPSVEVFDQRSIQIAHIRACRDPVFKEDRVIACQSVSYTRDRELKLKTKHTRF